MYNEGGAYKSYNFRKGITMVRDYWTLFYLSLIVGIFILVLICCVIIFAKKIFLSKKYGTIGLLLLLSFALLIASLCAVKFVACCKDYQLVSNNTYIEDEATVVEFTSIQRDWDGNGEIRYRQPKFYIPEKDEYIVLNIKDVVLSETYIVRYYPNTAIGEIVETGE